MTSRLVLSLPILLAACTDIGFTEVGPGGFGGDFGATPGGAQDIRYARELIEGGRVPTANDFTVEGLLSEHDLPTVGEPCSSLLCMRPALGVAPSLRTRQLEVWVQLGMTSGLPRATFQRPSLDVVAVIDKSSSMTGDIAETTEAVARMIGKLRQDDRIAVLAFDDDVTVLHELGAVRDTAALQATVRSIGAGGGFQLESAVERAFAIAESAGENPDRLRRVMVLSCGYPLVDPQGDDAFSRTVSGGAEDGIGFSLFGILLGYDDTLAAMLGKTRGASYYYLTGLEDVVQVFDEDFDTMVTPLAYDMKIELDVGTDFEIDRVYGVPGEREARSASLTVATAFLSRRRGALVARLRPTAQPVTWSEARSVGSVGLSYQPESAVGWSDPYEETSYLVSPVVETGGDTAYDGAGVRKAVALVNEADMMGSACTAYHKGFRTEAATILDRLIEYLDDEAEALDDDGLRKELALMRKLRRNVAP